MQKYFDFIFAQITCISLAVSSPTRGVSRSSRTSGWDAVDAGSVGRVDVMAGQALACERSGARGRTMLTRTVKSCGPDASTPASSLAEPSRPDRARTKPYPRGDGDKQARSPGRVRKKPLKPPCAGMPGDPGATVVTNARAFYTTRAAAGATGTRHSPRPHGGGRFHAPTRAHRAARREFAFEFKVPSLRAKRSNP